MSDIYSVISKKILVVGDLMLDTYFMGDVKRISPEAPVPVFNKKKEKSVLGGAGNVAANLVAAGQKVAVMSIIGNDKAGTKIKSLLKEQGINTDLIKYSGRVSTEKTRFIAMNNQQVMRLDVEDTNPISRDEYQDIIKELEEKISTFEMILLSDYLKGLLTVELTQSIIQIANDKGIPVLVDVKDNNFKKYVGATLLKPNLKELQDLTMLSVENDEQIISASKELKRKCKAKYVLSTCGGRGMALIGDGEPYFIDAIEQEVFDVTGAGDTAIAYLAACMVNGMKIRDSMNVANIAASIQVSKVGTSSVHWSEIRKKISKQSVNHFGKLIDEKNIDSFREDHRNQKIVFTNGCFDILHVGHTRYLQEAARLGDILIVGLNSDESVRSLKGPDRPINSQEDRAEMLCALNFVDYVIIFCEDTPLKLIKKIKPDILVKGGDYKLENVVGRKEVEKHGGKTVIIPFIEGKSSTRIIKKIESKKNESNAKTNSRKSSK